MDRRPARRRTPRLHPDGEFLLMLETTLADVVVAYHRILNANPRQRLI